MTIINRKSPYQQGELDMLCGVYSLLNIIKLLNPKSKSKARKLFVKVLRYLEKNKHQSFSKVMDNGLTFKDMKQLFKVFLIAEHLSWELPFCRREVPDLDHYWNTLMHLLQSHEVSCILIRLTGAYDHWTVVRAVTENTLILFDSDGHSRVNRINCGICAISPKPYILWPKQTFLIYPTVLESTSGNIS